MIFNSRLKSIILIMTLVVIATVLCACTPQQNNDSSISKSLVESTTKDNAEKTQQDHSSPISSSEKEDIKIDTYINLADSNTSVKGEGASFENSTLTITQSGTYSLTGTLTDGKIYINTNEEDKKVKLYLNGANISCSTDAPIFIENSPDETVIILAEGSVNTLSDTAREICSDEAADCATAVIYAKDDLQIEGKGTLNVKANFNKGIFSKNDIDIRNGNIHIESVDDAIRGKERVEISGGTLNIICGGDGIRTNEAAKEGKGSIEISGGSITINSDLDCIQSVVDINISGGSFNLTSDSGSIGVPVSSSDDSGMPNDMGGKPGGMGDRPGGMGGKPGIMGDGRDNKGGFDMYGGRMPDNSSANESTAEDTPSTKGIKADGKITVSGGTFTVSSTDDALHAVNLDIKGGTFALKSDDDGIHADDTVSIENSDIDITYSYEGIEGTVINIVSGTVKILSSDDGFNAAGDSTSNMNPMAADYNCEINIIDGYVFINASGDGVDSNGSVNQSGGTVIVFGPENGANGALDYGGNYTISGGTLLATGSAGMAQSVSGNGIGVLAFNYRCSADVLNAITDERGNCLIGFISPKRFDTVVFASNKLKNDTTCKIYTGGSFSGDNTDEVYLNGEYTPGELAGSLYLS